MSQNVAGWEHWPYNHAWFWMAHNPHTKEPGHVTISDQPTGGQTAWNIEIRKFDEIVQNYFKEMEKKIGQPIKMGNGKILHIAYKLLDEEADLMLQRQGQPGPTEPFTLVTVEGVEMENTPRSYWEKLIKAHIARREQEALVPLDFGEGVHLQVSFLFFDGMCKDYVRRRGDMIAAQCWPELMMRDTGQFKEGPRPVDGRPNALGQGASVMGPPGAGEPQGAPAPQAPQAPPGVQPNLANPAAEQQELV